MLLNLLIPKTNSFCAAILHSLLVKVFKCEAFFITGHQGFRISKIFGHPTLGSGGKKKFKRDHKSEHTNTQTDKHIDKLTYRKHRSRNWDENKKVNCDETLTQIVLKLKKSNSDEIQKLKW